MDAAAAPSNPPAGYTILRIKRRRDEEPLDALVVESGSRRKRGKGPGGMFQYAETVEDGVWKDETTQREIQEKISRLAKESETKADWKASVPPVPDRQSPLLSKQEPVAGVKRKYTIIEAEQDGPGQKAGPSSPLATNPPTGEVKSANDFKMYDAIPSAPPAEEVDPEMEKFQTLLNEFLSLNDVKPKPTPTAQPSSSEPIKSTGKATDTVVDAPRSDDYVWDVFYHRPATLTEWNEVAKVGTVSGFPTDEADGYSSGSGSEEEDEADEDSNDEGFYRNDYPDDEDDSDEWHDGSEYDDMMGYHDEREQFNF
ncbi:hypothetical protein FA15DRAFT_673326 [Coprinopsis marcescibilis]|uniref:Probable RNA polymerase II nuclear localization protein SLC7A6OS n=1 Tax=Coprinopsis marcescibilis TaxID=230819 RepID=A0A5C3KJU5_COPMA|nr:hypothetical protein FA15DRAFT_673326 [Coprinopsis marcescibilis]